MLTPRHMRLANKIVLATLNPDKFSEFKAIFQAYPEIELIPAEMIVRNSAKLGMVENHATYLENAIAKARLANHGCHYPALGDDTGLEVDCLGGRPGVRSHRYAKVPAGSFSKIAQDQANRELLLEEMKKAGGPRTARFKTTLALCIEGILVHATGTLEGSIADAPRGTHGFGYDSLFIPSGATQTLAEMTDTEKNQLSHRAKAAHELMTQVRARGIVFAKP
jgi:XTP/dITP diphosphohydrolase